MRGIVDSLCDYTGNMVRPWAEAGYECNCFDLRRHSPLVEEFAGGGIIRHWQVDVLRVYELPFARDGRKRTAAFGFPPCTDLAVSGARWFAEKGIRSLIDALELVDACREYLEAQFCPWMIENPVGRLSTCWRQPDYTFDPFEYAGYPGGEGDTYTKKTCIWTGGGFVMPEKRPIVPAPLFGINVEIDDRIHRMPPSENRGFMRSETPGGFARAVFEANAPRFALEVRG